MRKSIRGTLMAIGLGLLLILIFLLTCNPTVDFSGTIQEITRQEKTVVFAIADAFGNTYSVCADEQTMYRLYQGKWIKVDDLEVGDMISGNYRLFHKDRAGQVTVIDRT